jgi:RNA polymerase sigma-70 factor (ECF subfamily)
MSARSSAAGVAETDLGPSGDTAAQVCALPSFPEIYRQYFDFVWNGARSLGVGRDTIDDVVQEVFIVIHARIHTLREPSALRSWIYGIVRRTAFASLRVQRSRHTSVVDFTDDNTSAASLFTPSDVADQSDRAKLLWHLLEKLDESKREVFVMAEISEMTIPEIAQALEVPLGTASTRLRAARKAFEGALARYKANQKRGGHS